MVTRSDGIEYRLYRKCTTCDPVIKLYYECLDADKPFVCAVTKKKIENTSTDFNFLTAIRKHVSKVEDEKAEKEK